MNGIPQYNNNLQNDQWRQQFHDLQVDIWAFSETNVNWDRVPFRHRLSERTREWWDSRFCVVGHNQTDQEDDKFQPGGVGLLIRGPLTHRVFQSGIDDSGLGRWCWVRLRGQGQVYTRIVAAYRPVLNQIGPSSVYNQNRRFLLERNRNECPRDVFNKDLLEVVQRWVEEGDRVIIGIDANDDVRHCSLSQHLRDLGIHEVIITTHGATAPATYQRGTKPIDGIFVSTSVASVPCGYLPFGSGMISDHRPLWVDIPVAFIVGSLPPRVPPRIRRLQCRDPRIVERYLATFHSIMDQGNGYQRAQVLNQGVICDLLPADQLEWEALDALRSQAMIRAEKQCRKLCMGAVPWSPTLQAAIDSVTFCQLQLKSLNGGKVSSRRLGRLRKSSNIQSRAVSIPQAVQQLQEARTHYRALKKCASELRLTWLEELAYARAQKSGGNPSNQLAQLRRREQQRTEARTCKAVLGTLRNPPVMTVQTTAASGQILEHDSKLSIEDACIQENIRRFQQAHDTPFMQPPLSLSVNATASTPAALAISDGLWQSHFYVTPDIELVLNALHRPANVTSPREMQTITEEDHYYSWSRAREYTATGKSGLHFGHFMAGARDPVVKTFDTIMASIPFRTGYAPRRWKHGLDLAILKKPNSFHVETLRTILLLEPDFNALNKLLAQRAMANAEALHLLSPEQYGSRRNRSAAEHALNKRVMFDIARQTRQPLTLVSVDAKSCYDRIVWPVASLALQRLGVPLAPISMMLSTLQGMRHYIQTVHGTSDSFYDAALSPKFHGVGQGNGAAPAIWVAVSSPLLTIQRDLGFVAQFEAPMTRETTRISGFAFVDDTDLCQTIGPADTVGQLVQQAQRGLDNWNNVLRVTGGALEPAKSFWVSVSFRWVSGRWHYESQTEQPGELTMRDSRGARQRVERIEPNEGRRTLGVRLAPDGNNDAEVAYLRDCSYQWAHRIQQSRLPRPLVWYALTRILWPKLAYPLPATTLTRKQCEIIMSPALTVGLAASGFVRTFPRAVTHAPFDAFGLHLPHLFDLQGLAHITSAVKHGADDDSMTGRLLRCSIQHLQMELGLPGAVWSHDYDTWHYLATESWAKTLWAYLWETDLFLVDTLPSLQLSRRNDKFLMELFLALGFRKGELCSLNRCRLYLQVVTLADITTGCGSFVSVAARQGIYDVDLPRGVGWPQQGQPPRTDWALWRLALARFCQSSPTFRLPIPLGPWTTDTPIGAWCWSPSTDRLYRQVSRGNWVEYRGRLSRTRRSHGSRYEVQAHQIELADVPLDLLRGQAFVKGASVVTSGFVQSSLSPTSPRPQTLAQALKWPQPGTSWVSLETALLADDATIQEAFLFNQCIAASDGSWSNDVGTASWILATRQGRILAQGALFTPGDPADITALRSELAGLYAAILMIDRITSFLKVTSLTMELGSDCKGALARCFSKKIPQPTQPNYDLVTAIRHLMRSSTHHFVGRYVPAHQESQPGPRDIWEVLNIQADTVAKEFHSQIARRDLSDTRIWGEPWALKSSAKKFTSISRNQVYSHIAGPKGRAYWEKKRSLSSQQTSQLAWESIGEALHQTTLRRRHWAIKQATGFCATGKQMKRYKFWTHELCPRCGSAEDSQHVFLCSHPDAQALWQSALQELQIWMCEMNTHPDIKDYILYILRSWAFPTEQAAPTCSAGATSLLGEEQARLGGAAVLSGFFLQGWAEVQQQYYRWLGLQYSGARWLTQLIKKLWCIAWDFWDQRNGALHQHLGAQEKGINQEITDQYGLGWLQLPAADRRWFDTPLAQLLRKPKRTRRAWLRHAKLIRSRSEQIIDKELRRRRQFMHQWLSRTDRVSEDG